MHTIKILIMAKTIPIKNHSAKFYEEVEKVFPEYKKCHEWFNRNKRKHTSRILRKINGFRLFFKCNTNSASRASVYTLLHNLIFKL